MMKIEIEKDFPQYFKPAYPEEFELFSHFEVTAGIPTVLFAVTTWKENGKPNVCFHSWSCFHGDKTAFFAVMGNLYQHTHTYANIQREKCFCINFLPISCYDRLVNTIHQNEWDNDEFAAGASPSPGPARWCRGGWQSGRRSAPRRGGPSSRSPTSPNPSGR